VVNLFTRYCEEGVDEPQPDNEDVWFFNHSPIIDTRGWDWLDKLAKLLDPSTNSYKAFREVHDNNGNYTINSVPISANDVQSAMNEAIFGKEEGEIKIDGIGDDMKGTFVNLVKVFHPKKQLHTKIMERVFVEYAFDHGTRKEELKCHGVGGTLCASKEKAVSAADEFCKRTDQPSNKPQNPYAGTDDDMIIGLRNDIDENARILSHDKCVAGFKNIIDKCDGNEAKNNVSKLISASKIFHAN